MSADNPAGSRELAHVLCLMVFLSRRIAYGFLISRSIFSAGSIDLR